MKEIGSKDIGDIGSEVFGDDPKKLEDWLGGIKEGIEASNFSEPKKIVLAEVSNTINITKEKPESEAGEKEEERMEKLRAKLNPRRGETILDNKEEKKKVWGGGRVPDKNWRRDGNKTKEKNNDSRHVDGKKATKSKYGKTKEEYIVNQAEMPQANPPKEVMETPKEAIEMPVEASIEMSREIIEETARINEAGELIKNLYELEVNRKNLRDAQSMFRNQQEQLKQKMEEYDQNEANIKETELLIGGKFLALREDLDKQKKRQEGLSEDVREEKNTESKKWIEAKKNLDGNTENKKASEELLREIEIMAGVKEYIKSSMERLENSEK